MYICICSIGQSLYTNASIISRSQSIGGITQSRKSLKTKVRIRRSLGGERGLRRPNLEVTCKVDCRNIYVHVQGIYAILSHNCIYASI